MTLHKPALRFRPLDTASSRRTFGPYETVPISGRYVCIGCMQEIHCLGGDRFPPLGHHGHGASACPVSWRLKCDDD